MYNTAVANVNNLYNVESRPYFTGRLTEAQLEYERKLSEIKGEKIGNYKRSVIIAGKMLARGNTLEYIADITDLDVDTIRTIALPK